MTLDFPSIYHAHIQSKQGDQKIRKNIRPNIGKSSQNRRQKRHIIFIKAKFDSPKHLHQTPFNS